jgi:hypothetical protein
LRRDAQRADEILRDIRPGRPKPKRPGEKAGTGPPSVLAEWAEEWKRRDGGWPHLANMTAKEYGQDPAGFRARYTLSEIAELWKDSRAGHETYAVDYLY